MPRREALRKIFNRIDRDGSGTISVSEVSFGRIPGKEWDEGMKSVLSSLEHSVYA